MIEGFVIEWASVAAFVAAGAAIFSAVITSRLTRRHSDLEKDLRLLDYEKQRIEKITDVLCDAVTNARLSRLRVNTDQAQSLLFAEKEMAAMHKLSVLVWGSDVEGDALIDAAYKYSRGTSISGDDKSEALIEFLSAARCYLDKKTNDLIQKIESR